ncbi:sulfotransferase family protein [Lunatimonas salinarum]|uniref:sulfotransferase-like domain-containing protein n=1 Tax=Lunatimonas salinarum TaxID=1774590 RepID=UPI001FD74FC4|nr:sulfotransferase family protein [Lunatimonas salinarum]
MGGMQTTKRIFVWSGPRNISTALMYAFAQRTDTQVFDEPLYGYYLAHSPAKAYHPGTEDILRTMEHDGDRVVMAMQKNQEKPVLFYKNMCHHLLDLNRAFMKQGFNVILTREPREMLSSFREVIAKPAMNDVGYQAQVELLNYFRNESLPFVVVDSKDLLLNPAGYLERLCERIGIPFDPAMLSWEEGPRKEDGIWAPYWYSNVHRSTGFAPYKPKDVPFPSSLEPLLAACQPLYEKLMECKL